MEEQERKRGREGGSVRTREGVTEGNEEWRGIVRRENKGWQTCYIVEHQRVLYPYELL